MSTTRRSRLSIWWWELSYRIGPNLWVIPLLMSTGSVLLFSFTRWLDREFGEGGLRLPGVLAVDSSTDATIVLSALLGAVATALALVFSTSILTFSIASSQLGPRLIRRFMRDGVTQATLGAFMATLIFLVLTLASVRTDQVDGVPRYTVAVALLASLACFGTLVVYVHRVAATIQAPSVVASVVADLGAVLREFDTYLPDVPRAGSHTEVAAAAATARSSGGALLAARTGYVELVDHPRLLDAADGADAVIVLERRPGQFVVEGQTLAHVSPKDAAERVREIVAEGVEIGPARTLRQDLEFAIAQVVEIALRALSPAVNDTYTGLTCVDWLGAAMVEIGQHPVQHGGMCADSGQLRLVVPPLHYDRVLKTAFDQIRQAGDDNVAVLIRLLDSLGSMATLVRHDHLSALRAHADLVLDTAHHASFVRGDLDDIEQRHHRVTELIDARR